MRLGPLFFFSSLAITVLIVACGVVSTNMSLPSEWHTLNANPPAGSCPPAP